MMTLDKIAPLTAAALTALALAGCGSLAPGGANPPAPGAPVSPAWKGAASNVDWISANARRQWQTGQWWRLFGDAQLDELMPRVEVGNQNLAQAVANVAQARALLEQAQAARWPTLGLNLSASRSGKPASGTSGLNASGSWSPDLWGNLADAVRQQEANVQISQANLAEALLSAQGSFAQGYFTVREADAELALLDEIIAGYERAETITQNNYDAGISARTDLLQAQSALASARASRDQLAASRDTAEHALALLLGVPPAQFSLPRGQWTATVPQVPASLPADLLLRRPDIASAERAVAAANANIGIARAAYFPNIGLTASAGGAASSLSRLASAPVLAWALGLTAAEALFDGGARQGAVKQAQAERDADVATYRQTVLTAMGQVEDDLTNLSALAEQIEQTRIAAQAAQGVVERMMNSYQAGISAYTDVVTAQQTALTDRRSVLQLQLQRQQTAVGLIQALGGGWIAPWTGDKDGADGDVADSPAVTGGADPGMPSQGH
ncbi:MAG: efflux transporter outer membrane subunit [Burkholderiaceae bacterium]|jgi:NodT family efflux transporter outer membrane factor (OMF) lipoprotein|nr:efflux transporter outer membrane subunit [Burkholderiaceae bacterium]